jgi:SAM-dependent methyltransferase
VGNTILPDEEKAAVRATVFRHLSGIALAPTVKALWDRHVFGLFDGPGKWVSLDEVVARTGGNRGYLRVALRLLASAGWMLQRVSNNGTQASFAFTPAGVLALKVAPPLYAEVVSFLPKAVFLDDFLYGSSDEPVLPSLRAFVARAKEHWGIQFGTDEVFAKVGEQIRRHLEGMLIGPAMVALARGGVLAQLQQGSVKLSAMGNQASLACIFDLLATQGWVTREQDTVSLTACGHYAAQIATSYGVTVSYLPTFNVVSTLLFGNPRLPRLDDSGVELLVNRGMNVWGSGGAHKTYFRKVDEIVIEVFNRPLEQQPRGVCDMGCGDGTFLAHVYRVVQQKTARGKLLDKHPLILVGADFNKVARRVSKQKLRKEGIPTFHIIHGDINRPALLAGDLEQLGLDVHDLLHVRSFLDHNRPYLPPADYEKGSRRAKSTGAFASYGREIPPDELEENLVRHLRRWAPYVGRFGLLTLELHTLPPDVTAANLDRTPAVAYDGTHGFSDQYLVELPVFLDCVREAGLHADPRYQAKFPPSELATVSINYLTTN